MKVKVFIVLIFFVCCLLPGISFAQDKVVVIPLNEQTSARPAATMYEAFAAGADDVYTDMIDVSEGDCFLIKVSITAQDGTSADDTNTCTIFVDGTPVKWVLKARASDSGFTDCTARCLKW